MLNTSFWLNHRIIQKKTKFIWRQWKLTQINQQAKFEIIEIYKRVLIATLNFEGRKLKNVRVDRSSEN